MDIHSIRAVLAEGLVIPAQPLALDEQRRLSERHQRAITRYYLDAGAGGVAVGVHSTQFAIRDARHGLFEPVLALAAEEIERHGAATGRPVLRISGLCGPTAQAVAEAELASSLGYHAGLLSLAALRDSNLDDLVTHCAEVARRMPIIGFYLQPAVGGRVLPYSFWRRFVEIESVVAIKVAAFNRYQSLDVVRAVADSGRDDIALYTGNDDAIVADLVTPHRFAGRDWRFVGGLLGHWSVWTKRAVALLERCRREPASPDLMRLAAEVTDSNAAFFDAANAFHGCIAGLHEVLRRQGLLEGIWCLDEQEGLGPGQLAEIDRVQRAYPHLNDDDFVARHRDEWLRG